MSPDPLGQKSRKKLGDPSGWARTFETEDGIKLEGAYLRGKQKNGKEAPESAKTMIYFPSNGDTFDLHLTSHLTETFQENGYNILLFNYRGVGESEGHATKEGLFKDAEALYRYATEELKVPPENLLLYGHSLGAAVASHVVEKNPEVKFCHERSFTHLDKAAKSLVTNSLKGFIGHPLASLIGRAAGAAIRALDLNMDAETAFTTGDSGNRRAVYHPEDQLIDKKSGLAPNILNNEVSNRDSFQTIPLNKLEREDPHNRWVTKDEAALIYTHFNQSSSYLNESQSSFDFDEPLPPGLNLKPPSGGYRKRTPRPPKPLDVEEGT
jgi:pimeloyl-ACP methyl ester carboxylesterase